jgi:septal ring factor EnvC (AmiA/AmiB activator)
MRLSFRLPLRALGLALLVAGLLAPAGTARADVNPHDRLKSHVRDVVQEVKEAPTAEKKREILNEELRGMVKALDRVETMANLSEKDAEGVDELRSRVQAKIDELNGQNGFERVPDSQLDSFADYVQQDLEQADNEITIGVTTLLLILILILLLA